MYAKLFASIYQGTLRGNTHGLVVFTNMLAHADSAGWVDIHPRAIAEEVGLTVTEVNAAIAQLEAPDPESRSPEEEGRRIIRLDEHRVWGWRIVNHGKYRSIRDEEDRRTQNRIAQEKFRNKNKATKEEISNSKPHKPVSAQAEAEAEAEAEAYKTKAKATGKPDCPHQAIIDLYHSILPNCHAIRDWTPARATTLRTRWNEKEDRQNLEYWEKLFTYIAEIPFLTGKVSSAGRKPFLLSLDWLLKTENFAKVREGRYEE